MSNVPTTPADTIAYLQAALKAAVGIRAEAKVTAEAIIDDANDKADAIIDAAYQRADVDYKSAIAAEKGGGE